MNLQKLNPPSFQDLLDRAVTDPGTVSAAYSRFHNYSFGNQLLAASQCWTRGIPLGPLKTFPGWKALGRSVRKGEKAIVLCQPVTLKKTEQTDTGTEDRTFTRFVYRNSWFVLSQTDGAEFTAAELPAWDRARALGELGVSEVPFDLLNGNVQGYAKGRTVAINPVAEEPLSTLFHELAHILLGHTDTTIASDARQSRNIQEVEAESVAMLVCAALELPGVELSRAYIQGWARDMGKIPEASATKIFKTTDQILKAGSPVSRKEGE